MKSTDVIKLNQYVINNAKVLSSSTRGTLSDCAAAASKELGFKVPVSAMRDLMRNSGIDTKRLSQRRSEKLAMLGEIEKLTAENMELKRTLAKVFASDYIPADVKEFVFAGLKDEIRSAIVSVTS